ncbi:MAG: hypothetical protein ACRD0G_16750, partial [Acidimicrobiales bacterium]
MTIRRRLDDDELAIVHDVLDHAAPGDADRLLEDPVWEDIARSGRRHFAAVVDPDVYAQLTRNGASWALEVVPRAGIDGEAGEAALGEVLGVARREGGGTVHWWVHRPT